ncbi:MAG: lipid-binding SYLF domain-containing protein [Synergistaceae bacterium]|nr:lipid-binding SYLF domain-containing protein [Synergistaceae bacterium]
MNRMGKMFCVAFFAFASFVMAAVVLANFFAVPAWASKAESLVRDSIEVLKDMEEQDDVQSMADLIGDARAIAFVPAMIKAGFVIGGEYGEGLILRKERGKWFGPSFYNLGGGSLGLQIGVQKTAFILVVNNKEGVDAFLRSRSKLGADVAVAAGPLGRRGDAATDARMKASIYSYSMTKGFFAGASLDGSILSISVKRNKEYWKKDISASDALKIPATDKRILPLIKEIERISKKRGPAIVQMQSPRS